jgi:hypothetical protein
VPLTVTIVTWLFLAVTLFQKSSTANDTSQTSTPPPETHINHKISRRAVLAPVMSAYFSAPWSNSGTIAPGVYGEYGYWITPRFNMSLLTHWHRTLGSDALQGLEYGVILRHFLPHFECDTKSNSTCLYFDYGLIQQLTLRKSKNGSASSHSTRFGIGIDFTLGQIPLTAIAWYTYNVLRYFDEPKTALHHWSAALGYRFTLQ